MQHEPRGDLEEQLDGLLRRCDPLDNAALRAVGPQEALDDLCASLTRDPAQQRQSRRRSFIRSRAGVLAAAVVAATATVAAAAGLTAHTGHFQPTAAQIAHASPSEAAKMRSDVQLGGPGEFLNPAAADFRDVALEVASDIPYPEGYASWRDLVISDEISHADGSGTESTGALHGWFAASAFCAWVQGWRQADLAHDEQGAAAAEEVIAGAPGWKAVTDEDPHPSASMPNDQGTPTYSLFGWMLPYRDAVMAGDRATAERLLSTGYGDKCWLSDPQWRALGASHPEWGTLSRDQLAGKYLQFLAEERSR